MAPTISKTITQAGRHITRDDRSWGGDLGDAEGPISYAFRSTGGGSENADTFSRFSAAQIAAAEEALGLWSDVANITFSRNGGSGYSNTGTMLFANYEDPDDGASAYAYYPGSTSSSADAGDVWIDQNSSSNSNVSFGSRGFQTMMHEIGHAIGLQHPGSYNAGPDVTITYNDHAEYIQDTKQYSVMSYFSASETGADHVDGGTTFYAATPLLHDIAAVQRLYGANMSTRTGNDTYGFNSNVARESFRIDGASEKVVFAVWDAGGVDTFDFSGYSQNQVINLFAGQFSDVGALTKNVAIAQGATIENAKGGSGHDSITGNNFANQLTGNDGNDVMSGRAGSDRLVGGVGNDTHNGGLGADTMIGGFGNDTYHVDHAGDVVSDSWSFVVGPSTVKAAAPAPMKGLVFPAQQNAGIDTVYAARASYTLGNFIENLTASWTASPFVGTGNGLANVIQGANAGDTLNGLAGQDTILGLRGRDVLTGGSEADTFKFNAKADTGTTASTRDRITDFETDVDHIDLSAIDARDVFFTTLFPTKGGSIFTNEAFTFIGDQAFSGVAGELHYVHARSFPVVVARGAADIGPIDVGLFTNTIIEGDTNGDRIADFQIELTGRKIVDAADFIL